MKKFAWILLVLFSLSWATESYGWKCTCSFICSCNHLFCGKSSTTGSIWGYYAPSGFAGCAHHDKTPKQICDDYKNNDKWGEKIDSMCSGWCGTLGSSSVISVSCSVSP